jgi:hypothetical protein
MNQTTWLLLGALLAIIALQAVHRVAGALAAVVWCAAVTAWGLDELAKGAQISFFGITDPRVFVVVMSALTSYNIFVLGRAWRARKR